MLISAPESLNSESSTEGNISGNLEAMPTLIKKNSTEFILNSKRSADSVSEADCYNMSLGAGPLWWS